MNAKSAKLAKSAPVANVGAAAKGRKAPAVAVPPAPAPDAHAIARREALERQEAGTGRLLLDSFETCATHGAYTLEEVTQFYPSCGQPAQYVSNFGRAAKAAQVIGSAGALEVIRGAAAIEGGRAAVKIMDALSAVIEAGKARTANGHGGEATGNARTLIVAGAIRKAEKAQDERKPAKVAKGAQPGKVTTTKAPPTLGELVAGFIANAAQLSKATKPEGCSKAKWGRVMAAVNAAGEALAEFQTKPAK